MRKVGLRVIQIKNSIEALRMPIRLIGCSKKCCHQKDQCDLSPLLSRNKVFQRIT